jgi:hypothetical protein
LQIKLFSIKIYPAHPFLLGELEELSQYRAYATDWKTRVLFMAEAMVGFFTLHYHIQAGSGAHPASSPMGTGGCFSRT